MTNKQKAEKLMGKKPINPIGSCFDSAYLNFISPQQDIQPKDRLCHGIGIANMPGQKGSKMAHAWIEFDHHSGQRLAFDVIWGIVMPVSKYRGDLKLEYVKEYSLSEAITFGQIHDYSGPWDLNIKSIADKK